MHDLNSSTKQSKSFRQSWRDINPLRKENSVHHGLKRKTRLAVQRKSRFNIDLQTSKIENQPIHQNGKWQHLRIARGFGVSIPHAKLICSLAGIGGAND